MKKRKLSLGGKTISSIEFQVAIILQPRHEGIIEIGKILPYKTDAGNFVGITFRTSTNPKLALHRTFAIQKVGHCCDVWLDTPSNQFRKPTVIGAA